MYSNCYGDRGALSSLLTAFSCALTAFQGDSDHGERMGLAQTQV